MPTETITGYVYVDNVTVGNVTGQITDDAEEKGNLIRSKTYKITVAINGTVLGEAMVTIDDLVARQDGPGSVTNTTSGSVYVGASMVGTATIEFTDDYGDGQPQDVYISRYTARVVVQAGQQFSVEVTVVNSSSASKQVTLELVDENGRTVASRTITVNANSSATATLTATAPSDGQTHIWTLKMTAQ